MAFFATSHGKRACDGIGGMVKRLVTRASLQAPSENQIVTEEAMEVWVRLNIAHSTILCAFEYCSYYNPHEGPETRRAI